MSLTLAQGRALIRIIEAWDTGNHLTRPDVPTKTRAALFDAGLITIGTMVYPDSLHPTDDGRAAAEKIIGRLKRDPNTVHEPGSYEWARAREAEALDAQARHQADATWGSHPAGTDLVGAEVPTQDQLAHAEAEAHLEPGPGQLALFGSDAA